MNRITRFKFKRSRWWLAAACLAVVVGISGSMMLRHASAPTAYEVVDLPIEPLPFDQASFVQTTLLLLNQLKSENATLRAELQHVARVVDEHIRHVNHP